jgi:hypothetical protein
MNTRDRLLSSFRDVGIDPATVSALGFVVAEVCYALVGGLHNWPARRSLKRVDWTNAHYMEIVYGGPLSTFDFDNLTRLVFLAHDHALRVELSGAAPGAIRLRFHQRRREGDIFERHPTIGRALKAWRRTHPDTTWTQAELDAAEVRAEELGRVLDEALIE